MNCKLCGLPTPDPPLRHDGHEFCCYGCREVCRCFGAGVFTADREGTRRTPPPTQGKEAYLWIEGMHCASCEFMIEKIALKTRGILSAAANFATSTARIVYDPEVLRESDLPATLSWSGYRARLRGDGAPEYDERSDLLRLLTGGVLASALMMLSFLFVYLIHGCFAVPSDYEAIRWVAFDVTPLALFVLVSILVFYVGLPVLRVAWREIRAGMLNTDNLLALSILSAYVYSVVQLFHDTLNLYFEVAGSLVAVVTIGRFLERSTRMRATRELNTIMQAWSFKACVLRNEKCLVCGLEGLVPDDRVFVRSGGMILVDGTIVGGQGAVDESLMTGKPFPVSRSLGGKALGGTVLREGELEIEVGSRVESRLANLARILWNAQSSTGGIQGCVDRLSHFFVLAVLVLAAMVGGRFSYRRRVLREGAARQFGDPDRLLVPAPSDWRSR